MKFPLSIPPKRILLVLSLLVVIIFLLAWVSKQAQIQPLKVTSTTPPNKAEDVAVNLSQITVTFSRPLKDLREIQVNLFPQVKFSPRLEQNNQVLILKLNESFLSNEIYNLEIINTKTGETLSPLSFKTIKPEEVVKKVGRGDPNLVPKIHEKDKQDFPLLHWVPYSSPEFEADYLSPLKLEVKLKTASESAKPALQEWIKSHGVNPTTHEIIYTNP